MINQYIVYQSNLMMCDLDFELSFDFSPKIEKNYNNAILQSPPSITRYNYSIIVYFHIYTMNIDILM